MMMPHKIAAPPCPHCRGEEYVVATDDAIEPGDWLLCINCAGVFYMRSDRTVRATRHDEWRSVPPVTRAAVASIKAMLPIIRRARSANP